MLQKCEVNEMVTLKEAVEIAKKEHGDLGVYNKASDLGEAWVFDYKEEADISPTMVEKNTGNVSMFFPPDYPDEIMDNAKEIDISQFL